MKKISYFIFVIFIIFSFCVIGCRSPEKDPDVARLQAEVEALKKSLLSTQQELAYTRESMTDLMEQTSAIQSQVQEEKECTVSCETVQNCLPYAAEIVPSPYYLYPNQCAGYNPFLPYGYRTSLWNWPPPPPRPKRRPPCPPPPPACPALPPPPCPSFTPPPHLPFPPPPPEPLTLQVIVDEDEEVTMSLQVSQPVEIQPVEQLEQMTTSEPLTSQVIVGEDEEVITSLQVSPPVEAQTVEEPEQTTTPEPITTQDMVSSDEEVAMSLQVSQPVEIQAVEQQEQITTPASLTPQVTVGEDEDVAVSLQVSQPSVVQPVEQTEQSLPSPPLPAPPPPPQLSPPPGSLTPQSTVDGEKEEITVSLQVSQPLTVRTVERPKRLPQPIAPPKLMSQDKVSKGNKIAIAKLPKDQTNLDARNTNAAKRIKKDDSEEEIADK